MLDVRQLVAEHAFELIVGQQPQDAFGRGHRRVLRVAPGRERVGRRIGNDVAARLRQAGALRQPIDDVEQSMARPDFLRVVHAQDDLVREPVRREVGRHREHEADRHAAGAAERFADEQEQRAHRSKQQRRLHRVVHIQLSAYAIALRQNPLTAFGCKLSV